MNTPATPYSVWRLLAPIAMLTAGAIHLIMTPPHWAEAPVLGLFFAGVGLAELAWAVAFWLRPSAALYRVGIVLAGSLITLWAITRLLPAPYHSGPESVDLSGVVCKLCEMIGIVSLVVLASSGMVAGQSQRSAWRSATALVIAAFVVGLLLYGSGLAAEMLLPGMTSPEHEHDEGHEHDQKHHSDGNEDSHYLRYDQRKV